MKKRKYKQLSLFPTNENRTPKQYRINPSEPFWGWKIDLTQAEISSYNYINSSLLKKMKNDPSTTIRANNR